MVVGTSRGSWVVGRGSWVWAWVKVVCVGLKITIPPTPLDSPFLRLVLKPELWSSINPHSLALIPVMAPNVVSLLELTKLKDFVASSSFVRT